jgi:hypothetical protein
MLRWHVGSRVAKHTNPTATDAATFYLHTIPGGFFKDPPSSPSVIDGCPSPPVLPSRSSSDASASLVFAQPAPASSFLSPPTSATSKLRTSNTANVSFESHSHPHQAIRRTCAAAITTAKGSGSTATSSRWICSDSVRPGTSSNGYSRASKCEYAKPG